MRIAGARTARLENIWASGEYIGRTAATARATIRPGNIRLTPTRDYGDFASIMFSHTQGLYGTAMSMFPREVPNIKSVQWTRGVDQDIASATIEIYNTLEDPNTGEIQGGYFTWNRGDSPFSKKHSVTTEPSVAGVNAWQKSTFTATNSVEQSFKKTDETAKVKKIRITVPAGGAGTYTVGIKSDPNGDPTKYLTATAGNSMTGFTTRKPILKAVIDQHAQVALAEGENYVSLPAPIELRQDSWYRLYITASRPRTFPVQISSQGTTTKEFLDFAPPNVDPGYTPRAPHNVIIDGQEHVLFELIGPAVTTVIGNRNDWYGWLVPDNIIQTFEGYGVNWAVNPEADENLLITGTWLIDSVENNGSIITLKCRDFGRLLADQILFPPVVPRKSAIAGIQYPVYFFSDKKTPYPASTKYTKVAMKLADSSNRPYVGYDGRVAGHYPHQAFDGNSATYWLSVGNQHANDGYSFEWIEGKVGKETIGAVEVRTAAGHYRAWVSVYANGHWVNKGHIPYDPNNPVSAPNGANIPYVASFNCKGDNELNRIEFTPIPGATRIRITFTNLQNSGVGPYVLRAGVREMVAYAEKTIPGGEKTIPGNYKDYSDIVKLFLAWGGFHWPTGLPGMGLSSNKIAFYYRKPPNDPYLKEGAIWGDIEMTGTYGPVTLPIDSFDKRPIMDGISAIRDIVGFYFGIDETGAAIWRSPNWFERGNFVAGAVDSTGKGARTQKMLRILDTQTLQDVTATLSSHDVRERFYIATPDGRFVGGARGYNLNPIGMRRVAGWIDQHFVSNAECAGMANLIAISAMMNYRTLDITIAGIPTLQVDDQVEVVDTATGEGYVHYVRNISSKLDHSTGEYVYTVTTNWLGTRPGDKWMLQDYTGTDGKKYRVINSDIQVLLDFSDRGRKDGVYDQMGAVTLWASGDYSSYLDNGGS
jgi:hypothetical protein